MFRELSFVSAEHKIIIKGELDEQDYRNTHSKFLVLGLVAEEVHSKERSHAAAHDGKPD